MYNSRYSWILGPTVLNNSGVVDRYMKETHFDKCLHYVVLIVIQGK